MVITQCSSEQEMKKHSTPDNLCWTCLGAVRKGGRTPHTLCLCVLSTPTPGTGSETPTETTQTLFLAAVMCLKCTFTRTLPSVEEEPKPLPQVAPALFTTRSAGSSLSLLCFRPKKRLPRSPARFCNGTVLSNGSGQTPGASSHWVSNTFWDGNSVTSLTMVEVPASDTASNPAMLLDSSVFPCPLSRALHAGQLQLYPFLSLSYPRISEVIKPYSYSVTKTIKTLLY